MVVQQTMCHFISQVGAKGIGKYSPYFEACILSKYRMCLR